MPSVRKMLCRVGSLRVLGQVLWCEVNRSGARLSGRREGLHILCAGCLTPMRTQTSMKSPAKALFSVGQIVRHKRLGYRGVVVDVDATFSLSQAWYEQMARSRPPKDKPWYHVLVHQAQHQTYVAERHLEIDAGSAQIDHPLLGAHFDRFVDGQYRVRRLDS
jgi:heat shock protein HspQ